MSTLEPSSRSGSPPEREDTYGGLVIDPERCAYCAAWPEEPCALHRKPWDPNELVEMLPI